MKMQFKTFSEIFCSNSVPTYFRRRFQLPLVMLYCCQLCRGPCLLLSVPRPVPVPPAVPSPGTAGGGGMPQLLSDAGAGGGGGQQRGHEDLPEQWREVFGCRDSG